jgi:hypothetical protein
MNTLVGYHLLLCSVPQFNTYPGGIQIEGLGSTDIDNQVEFQNSTAVGGLALELHRRLSTHYGRLSQLEEVVAKRLKVPEMWKFESSVLKRILAEWLAEYPELVVVRVRILYAFLLLSELF